MTDVKMRNIHLKEMMIIVPHFGVLGAHGAQWGTNEVQNRKTVSKFERNDLIYSYDVKTRNIHSIRLKLDDDNWLFD